MSFKKSKTKKLTGGVNLFLKPHRRKTLDRAADQRPPQGGGSLPRSPVARLRAWGPYKFPSAGQAKGPENSSIPIPFLSIC